MENHDNESRGQLRWGIYLVLIAIAVGNISGRLMAVDSVDLTRLEAYRIDLQLQKDRQRYQAEGLAGESLSERLERREKELERRLRLARPFLSGNDRSRWLTIRALVENGTYAIDELIEEPTWDTIDMVQHRGRDGELHLYSSKPPLLPTLLAGKYWLVQRLSGATLATHPYAIGRLLLVTTNILPLVLMYGVLGWLVERFGTTEWGRVFVMAAATMGTFLNTFAVTLNNHLVAAVSAAVAIYAVVRIWFDGERRPGLFILAGVAAAFTAANDLPALAFTAAVFLVLLRQAARPTWTQFVPAALVVVGAFFATNFAAHSSFLPAYAHHGAEGENWYEFEYEVNGRVRQSYWSDPAGIDLGEESRLTYALHALIGHHGVLSLTPVWLLSIVGCGCWLRGKDRDRRTLALMIAGITIVCLVFYLGLRPQSQRNYGGMTSGLRWMFWFAPLWLLLMVPAADRLARSRPGQATAAALLALSVFSAAYPTWNPWTHPWLYDWMVYGGWSVLGK